MPRGEAATDAHRNRWESLIESTAASPPRVWWRNPHYLLKALSQRRLALIPWRLLGSRMPVGLPAARSVLLIVPHPDSPTCVELLDASLGWKSLPGTSSTVDRRESTKTPQQASPSPRKDGTIFF